MRKDRGSIIIFLLIAGILSIVARLFYLQVLSEEYALLSFQETIKKIQVLPPRGKIYDRHGHLLVGNQNSYEIVYYPYRCNTRERKLLLSRLDTSIPFHLREEIANGKNKYAHITLYSGLLPDAFSTIYPAMVEIPCVEYVPRPVRKYLCECGSHVFGYVGIADSTDLEKNPELELNDGIGKTGLERIYDFFLRGQKGYRYFQRDAFGRLIEPYKNGKYDVPVVPGTDLYSTLDIELQRYAELLMKGKKGAVVAIEPFSGEVLALVSSPAYPPELLAGRMLRVNFFTLLRDPQKPLLNRALQGVYPPGSTFKIANALVALNEGVVTPYFSAPCVPSVVGCHPHPYPSSMKRGIQFSCNGYFYFLFKRILEREGKSRFKEAHDNLAIWRKYMKEFGFGSKLGIDLPYEASGFIPDTGYYDRIYGRQRWAFSTIYSLSIGQGEVAVTPLQMANFAAIIANRGKYKIPHLVRKIGTLDTDSLLYRFHKWHTTSIRKEAYEAVIKGMEAAVNEPGGTAYLVRTPWFRMAGKTGTAQNPHGKDHSLFICFAPVDTPLIAVAVVVENAGFGAQWAAPIASLIVERYLTGGITRKDLEKYIMEKNP